MAFVAPMVAGFTPFFAPWSLLHPAAAADSALVMLATTEVAVTFGAHRRRKQEGSSTAVAGRRAGKGKRWKDRLRLRPQKTKPVMNTPEPESFSTPRQRIVPLNSAGTGATAMAADDLRYSRAARGAAPAEGAPAWSPGRVSDRE
ncbi:unnamed protein product, partial [Pylaiella littoralis]